MNWNEALDCGCGGYTEDDEEIERIIREIEEDDTPTVIPVTPERIDVTEEFERVLVPVKREAEVDG